MHVSGWKKLILGIVATILLGAVGSGMWEMALRPAIQWAGRTILTVATLGSTTVKDEIYREAARGPHEAVSIQLYAIAVTAQLMLLGAVGGYLAGRRAGSRKSSKMRERLSSLEPETAHSFLSAELAAARKGLFLSLASLAVFSLLLIGIQLTSYLKLIQANNAFTFFSQSMSICRPYMDDQQTRLLSSRFAGIRSREDYIGVIRDLKRIAAENQQHLPDFTPW